jgi:hypothetical protein
MNQWIARTRAIRVQYKKKPNRKPYLAMNNVTPLPETMTSNYRELEMSTLADVTHLAHFILTHRILHSFYM